VARRRTCFSCGQAQSGNGAFCSSCGKLVDAPDLELLSGGTLTDVGSDVSLARGDGSRFRSLLVIGAVIAAVGSAAAFTGNNAKSSSTSTTSTTEPTTTTTEETTTTVARTVPRKLDTLPLPGETTGATLLLLGSPTGNGNLEKNRILDIDRGVLTTLDDRRANNGNPIVIVPTSKGLVAVPQFGGGVMELWQRDGSMQPIPGDGLANRQQVVFAGDTVWAIETEFDPSGGGNPRLTSFTLRNGQRVVWLEDASQTLIGVDAKGRPVVRGSDGGAFTFDPLTKQMNRLTTAVVEAISARGRVEVECTDTMICGHVFRNADGPSQRLDFPAVIYGSVSLSPDGKYALMVGYRNGSEVTYDVADTATGAVVRLGTFTQDRYQAAIPTWTADGRWLFVQVDDGLAAWRAGLDKPIPLLAEGKPIQAFAVGVFPN
jgi:hypothetical protein